MADPTILAGWMYTADTKTLEIVKKLTTPERRRYLTTYYSKPPYVGADPIQYAAFQAELLAAALEEIDALTTRVEALENPPVAAATAPEVDELAERIAALEPPPELEAESEPEPDKPKRGRPKKEADQDN